MIRPIIFSGPMVRAILEGRKTQTRRVIKKPEYFACLTGDCPHWDKKVCADEMQLQSPYGQPGDRLWVRETWLQTPAGIAFRADGGDHYGAGGKLKWKPSIFMPHQFSRLTLELTGIRVERLQEISEADAKAEGCESNEICPDVRTNYRAVWDSLNAEHSPWVSNPWVFVIDFKRM
jgi:hypothetical protein